MRPEVSRGVQLDFCPNSRRRESREHVGSSREPTPRVRREPVSDDSCKSSLPAVATSDGARQRASCVVEALGRSKTSPSLSSASSGSAAGFNGSKPPSCTSNPDSCDVTSGGVLERGMSGESCSTEHTQAIASARAALPGMCIRAVSTIPSHPAGRQRRQRRAQTSEGVLASAGGGGRVRLPGRGAQRAVRVPCTL